MRRGNRSLTYIVKGTYLYSPVSRSRGRNLNMRCHERQRLTSRSFLAD